MHWLEAHPERHSPGLQVSYIQGDTGYCLRSAHVQACSTPAPAQSLYCCCRESQECCLSSEVHQSRPSWSACHATSLLLCCLTPCMPSIISLPVAADKVGMYAINCPEWMLVLQACNRNTLYCGKHSLLYLLLKLLTCKVTDHLKWHMVPWELLSQNPQALPACKVSIASMAAVSSNPCWFRVP